MRRLTKGEGVTGWIFTIPYLAFTFVFFILPFLWGFLLIFSEWNLISPVREFVGLGNLIEALQSRRVHAAALVPFKIMAIFLPAVLIMSLGIAVLINSFKKRQGLLAVAFFLPYLASGVSMSLVVKGVVSYTSPVNKTISSIIGYVPDWLGTPSLAILVIALMIAWRFSGYYALIFLSGLQSIPNELYEAAQIDGAGRIKSFFKITIPQLYPALYSVMILAVGLMFGVFTEPYMLTGGGPNLATHTWYLEIYYQAFNTLRAGYASSIALYNAIAVFIVVGIVRRIMQAWGRAHGWED
ncbi:MAG: sugar ABC transporter permease [Firmicutes bacterium]|jgi:multiple sugar transport system permease protein|nr:sugar ABC transporter permease [Bacillota bacterium]